ncbi:MAG: amidohydrolase [Phyllobacteriaceae bacterium]|nr:amidohydrolase [Phyllobacteriaceae bacterium]
MPLLNRAADMQAEIAEWRRALHAMPELGFDLHRTSAFVAARLREFGVDDVVEGLAKTGIVAIVNGIHGDGPTIGLRADMDALPIVEGTGRDWASGNAGVMHACGHDGHTAMLLGAAKYLAETRNFAGRVALVFQPAEEGGGGGKVMVDEGLMERFGISRVFGLHNMPGLDVGNFAIKSGPIMASTAEFTIQVRGKGGHAAMPDRTTDPIVIASQIVLALQTIVSRNADPVESLVVSVTKFHAGDAYNIIPETVEIAGTVRALKNEMAALGERRIREIVAGIAAAGGGSVDIDYDANYPVTFNHPSETALAVEAARGVAGVANVDPETPPVMGGEDFSYMLNARPGAYILMGNGATAGLHNPAYDFNDEAIAHGVSYWARLTETVLAGD